jgi:hypothetical protein
VFFCTWSCDRLINEDIESGVTIRSIKNME